MSHQSQSGFTLLESIVAMFLVAAIGSSLLAWMNEGLTSLARVSAHQQETVLSRQVLAYLQTVNIMERPEGKERLGNLMVRWQSRLVEPVRDGVLLNGPGKSPFQFGLYDVDAFVMNDGKPAEERHFRVRLVGYKQVRVMLPGM